MMARFFNIKMLCAIIVAVLLLGGFAGVEKAAADDASTLFKRSSEKMELGDYEGADKDYEEAIKRRPCRVRMAEEQYYAALDNNKLAT